MRDLQSFSRPKKSDVLISSLFCHVVKVSYLKLLSLNAGTFPHWMLILFQFMGYVPYEQHGTNLKVVESN